MFVTISIFFPSFVGCGTYLRPSTTSLKSLPVMHVYGLSLIYCSVTIPAFFEMAMAVSMLSPVHMMT
jgi:hypothetical protein